MLKKSINFTLVTDLNTELEHCLINIYTEITEHRWCDRDFCECYRMLEIGETGVNSYCLLQAHALLGELWLLYLEKFV